MAHSTNSKNEITFTIQDHYVLILLKCILFVLHFSLHVEVKSYNHFLSNTRMQMKANTGSTTRN